MSCQTSKIEYWKIMIWLSDTKCCHLAIQNMLPKDWPGPNLNFRFMKNPVHTSLLGSLLLVFKIHWLCFNFFKLFCIKSSFALTKGSSIPDWLMCQSENKRMPCNFSIFLTKFCNCGHSAPAELTASTQLLLIRQIWFWEIWK